MVAEKRLTTKEKVAKLKADLKRKMAIMRGEIVEDDEEEKKESDMEEKKLPEEKVADTSIITIDTSK